MIPPPFRYLGPRSLSEALSLLAGNEGAVVLAGGQSLVNALKLDLVQPTAVVDVHRLPELRDVRQGDGGLVSGAAVTYAELAASPLVREHLPVLADVSGRLVDRQVRNRGTIGGNCCLNDPTNNLPALLAALGATFEVHEHDRPGRTLDADDFFLGTLLTVATGPAMLTSVTVPVPGPGAAVAYRHQLVGADSWALARAVVRIDLAGGRSTDPRVYLGAVPDSPLRLPAVEAVLDGAVPGHDRGAHLVQEGLAAFDAEQVETVGDSHGSAGYRLAMTRVQLKRALTDIAVPNPAEEAAA